MLFYYFSAAKLVTESVKSKDVQLTGKVVGIGNFIFKIFLYGN